MERAKTFLAENRGMVAVVALVLSAMLFIAGVYQLLTYSLPMFKADYYTAIQSVSADKATVLYDAGLQAFRAGNYDQAQHLFAAVSGACNDASGNIPGSRLKLAAQAQFMLGNSFDALGKTQQAIEAYQQSLRLDSANLYAKYNLERLLAPPPPQSSSAGQGNQQGQQAGQQGQQGDQQGGQGKQPGQAQPGNQQGNQEGNPQADRQPGNQQPGSNGQQGDRKGPPGRGAGKGAGKGI